MNTRLKEAVVYNSIAIIILLLAFMTMVFNPSFFNRICVEDGVVEWITTIAFLLASIFFIVSLSRSNKIKHAHSRTLASVMTICFALFSFFCFGEEISWGQRIFDLELSSKYQVDQYHQLEGSFQNIQNETNLHNMGFIEKIGNRVIIMGIQLIMGIIFPVLVNIKLFSRYFKRIYHPVPSFALTMFFIGGIMLIATKFFYHPGVVDNVYIYDRVNEFSEMMMSFGFLIFSLWGIRRPDYNLL